MKLMTGLYEATIDDMIQAFVQIANYHNWIEGGLYGKNPDQTSLKLKAATYTGDPKLLAKG